jgi:hypothetical protein
MDFIPEQPSERQEVPYFEDATSESGWRGQSTTKAIKTLQSEIIEAVSRLGGLVINFQRGSFTGEAFDREGFRVHYVVQAADGRQVPGRIDIAALPVRSDTPKKREASLKMALYMLREALDGTWLLQQLSPGYSALVPFMLGRGTDKTISQLWSESPIMNQLLPPGEDEGFVEGETREL